MVWLEEQPHRKVYTKRPVDTPLAHWLRALYPDDFIEVRSLITQVNGALISTPLWMRRLLLAFCARSMTATVAHQVAQRVLNGTE